MPIQLAADTYYSVDEAAVKLGWQPRRVREWCAAGKLRGAKRLASARSTWLIPGSALICCMTRGETDMMKREPGTQIDWRARREQARAAFDRTKYSEHNSAHCDKCWIDTEDPEFEAYHPFTPTKECADAGNSHDGHGCQCFRRTEEVVAPPRERRRNRKLIR